MSFAERLKLAREARGMTQQSIADLMGIDKSTYCGYETGKRQPDVQKIKQLSSILGVSGDDLLETGYKKAPTLEIEDGRNVVRFAGRDGRYIVKRLTDEQLDALTTLIDQLPEAEDI